MLDRWALRLLRPPIDALALVASPVMLIGLEIDNSPDVPAEKMVFEM